VRSLYALNNESAACRFIDGEAVLLNAETSAYYTMNPTGTFILKELIVAGREPSDVSRLLEDRFGASAGDWDGDVRETIEQLRSEGLIVLKEDSSAASAIEGADEVDLPANYEKPVLERHGELEQLILSGE
jgi:hypothetical protein